MDVVHINVVLDSEEPISLPIHYNEYVQAIVYDTLDRDISDFLHNQGFQYGNRRFKLFSFSRIFGKFKIVRDRIVFSPPINFYVSFAFKEIVLSFLRNISGRSLKIGKNLAKVVQVQAVSIPIESNSITVKTLSPITVYRTIVRNGRRYTLYMQPDDPQFEELIISNLRRKFFVIHNEEYRGRIHLETVKLSGLSIVKYKGFVVKGWNGIFRVEADRELLKVALCCGLGAKNSQGFGMVKPIG